MNKDLFVKYFNNTCSPDEFEAVLEWLRKEAHGLTDHEMVYKTWKDYKGDDINSDEEKFEQMLDKVHHRINLLQSSNPEHIKFNSAGKFFNSAVRFISRAAAILFLPLLVLMVYQNMGQDPGLSGRNSGASDTIEIVAPIGSRADIVLPDGTRVNLNHGSRLRYPQKFTGKYRRVELTGEAYLSVRHDPDKPFIVETPQLLVTATGTDFNVMAYHADRYVDATLVDGKIFIQKKNRGNILQEVCEMTPDHHMKFDLTRNVYNYESVDPSKYISWKDGILIFRDDPLEEITKRLSRWYNVEFVFRNEAVKEFSYTATFVDETLPQILDLLKLATPIDYEITSRVKLPDGTFSKPKVLIYVKQFKNS